MQQLEVDSKLRTRLAEYLQKQGYEVTEGAKLLGKSEIEHTFDMLAQKHNGLTALRIAFCIFSGTNGKSEADAIFSFANKAYDTGIPDRVLISVPELSEEAKKLAKKQRIKIIDGKQVDSLLDSQPRQPTKPPKPLSLKTKSELAEFLMSLGYKVEEGARIQGKSGNEYVFDMLARSQDAGVVHTLGLDFIKDKEVGLESLAIFDAKAYDAGIDDKVIVISHGLSPEATQFAKQQRVKVLMLGQEPFPEPSPTAAASGQQGQEPAQLGKLVAPVRETEPLRQKPEPKALQLIPEIVARRYNAVPLTISGNTLKMAMVNPSDIFALEAFSTLARMRIEPVVASAQEVRDAIDLNYKGYGEIEKQVSRIDVPNGMTDEGIALGAAVDTPLTQTLNLIIEEAVKARSSDIHIEPDENRVRVRYRIDGILQEIMSLPPSISRPLLSRIKVLADLNIADHQHPQDGQFSTTINEREIDVRVATAPSVWGEMAVLRLLDKSMAILGLSELGMLPDCLAKYQEMLKVSYGMILISGPTGAGKTTTLYGSVNSLDNKQSNIVTIEDPAEYRFDGVNQIQVNNQANITFATGLRSILRLDPDVILVGEIRDAETANIAVQAALTGHLMLSSIHAGDTVGVLFRLRDLKVEPFLIASSVIGVVAQRMVRRICSDCSKLIEAPAVEQRVYEQEMGEKRSKFLYGTSCRSCAYTGYRGRVGLFEILTISDTIRMMIMNGASSSEIRSQGLKEGMVPLVNDGMRKVKEGITTPSEVLRAAYTLGN